MCNYGGFAGKYDIVLLAAIAAVEKKYETGTCNFSGSGKKM